MANLSEEQMKRIFLGILVLGGLVGLAWYLLLAPQKESMITERKNIEELQANIKKAESAIKKAASIAGETNAANADFESITRDIPTGTPVAWVPPQINNYWRRQGFVDVTTNPSGSSSADNPALTGFEKRVWTVSINNAPFIDFGIALSEFENKEILMQVSSLNVSATSGNPETQNVQMTVDQLLPETTDQ